MTHAPLAAGRRHTVRCLPNGQVVAVGADDAGECRVSQWRGVIAVAAGSVHAAANTGRSHTLGLRDDGTVLACGWNAQGQCDVRDWRDVVASRRMEIQRRTAHRRDAGDHRPRRRGTTAG